MADVSPSRGVMLTSRCQASWHRRPGICTWNVARASITEVAWALARTASVFTADSTGFNGVKELQASSNGL